MIKTQAIIIDDLLIYREDFSEKISKCYAFDRVKVGKSFNDLKEMDLDGYNTIALLDVNLNEYNKKNRDGFKCVSYIRSIEENAFLAT